MCIKQQRSSTISESLKDKHPLKKRKSVFLYCRTWSKSLQVEPKKPPNCAIHLQVPVHVLAHYHPCLPQHNHPGNFDIFLLNWQTSDGCLAFASNVPFSFLSGDGASSPARVVGRVPRVHQPHLPLPLHPRDAHEDVRNDILGEWIFVFSIQYLVWEIVLILLQYIIHSCRATWSRSSTDLTSLLSAVPSWNTHSSNVRLVSIIWIKFPVKPIYQISSSRPSFSVEIVPRLCLQWAFLWWGVFVSWEHSRLQSK